MMYKALEEDIYLQYNISINVEHVDKMLAQLINEVILFYLYSVSHSMFPDSFTAISSTGKHIDRAFLGHHICTCVQQMTCS